MDSAAAGFDFVVVLAAAFLCFALAAVAPFVSLPHEPLPHAESFPLAVSVFFSAINMVPVLLDFAIASPVKVNAVPDAMLRVASNATASSGLFMITST